MLTSQFRFVASATNTAQAMIRFADDKAEMLFYGFLGSLFVALSFAVTTTHPRFAPRGDAGAADRRRLSWYHDVLARDREESLAAVRGLRDEDVLGEMAHELYDAQAIERAKFADITKATRISGWGLALWLLTLILSFSV